MTKYFVRVSAVLFLLQLVFAGAIQAESETKKLMTTVDLARRNEITKNRIIKQPNGPFAAIVFDEYALAIHTCVIFYENMGVPVEGKWSISERTWCSDKWGSDITSMYWSPDGKSLYLATSSIYGDGGVFKLNLYNKKFIKVYPTAKKGSKYVSATEIIGSAKDGLTLKVEFSEIVEEKGKLPEDRFVEEKEITLPLKQ